MTLLQLLAEGSIAAAELVALLLVPPATAIEPARPDGADALAQPVALHRLSTAVDVRLLGSLADVRVVQRLHNDGASTADLGPRLPVIDGTVDSLRVVRGGHAVELLPNGGCGDEPADDNAGVADDETIADALQLGAGQDAIVEAAASVPLMRGAGGYRVALPVVVERDEPQTAVVDQDDVQFLLVVPHRTAASATLVIRSVTGESEWLRLGAVDPGSAVLIPLKSRAHLENIAEGAIELELVDGGWTYWTTLAVERIDARAAAQVRVAD